MSKRLSGGGLFFRSWACVFLLISVMFAGDALKRPQFDGWQYALFFLVMAVMGEVAADYRFRHDPL